MRLLNGSMTWSLKIFFKYMERATWIVLLVGALAVCLASISSIESIAITVKSPAIIALLTNIICVLFVLFKFNSLNLDRLTIVATLESNRNSGLDIFKKYGLLLIGYVNLLFWGGWFMCGMLLIIFFGRK